MMEMIVEQPRLNKLNLKKNFIIIKWKKSKTKNNRQTILNNVCRCTRSQEMAAHEWLFPQVVQNSTHPQLLFFTKKILKFT